MTDFGAEKAKERRRAMRKKGDELKEKLLTLEKVVLMLPLLHLEPHRKGSSSLIAVAFTSTLSRRKPLDSQGSYRIILITT